MIHKESIKNILSQLEESIEVFMHKIAMLDFDADQNKIRAIATKLDSANPHELNAIYIEAGTLKRQLHCFMLQEMIDALEREENNTSPLDDLLQTLKRELSDLSSDSRTMAFRSKHLIAYMEQYRNHNDNFNGFTPQAITKQRITSNKKRRKIASPVIMPAQTDNTLEVLTQQLTQTNYQINQTYNHIKGAAFLLTQEYSSREKSPIVQQQIYFLDAILKNTYQECVQRDEQFAQIDQIDETKELFGKKHKLGEKIQANNSLLVQLNKAADLVAIIKDTLSQEPELTAQLVAVKNRFLQLYKRHKALPIYECPSLEQEPQPKELYAAHQEFNHKLHAIVKLASEEVAQANKYFCETKKTRVQVRIYEEAAIALYQLYSARNDNTLTLSKKLLLIIDLRQELLENCTQTLNDYQKKIAIDLEKLLIYEPFINKGLFVSKFNLLKEKIQQANLTKNSATVVISKFKKNLMTQLSSLENSYLFQVKDINVSCHNKIKNEILRMANLFQLIKSEPRLQQRLDIFTIESNELLIALELQEQSLRHHHKLNVININIIETLQKEILSIEQKVKDVIGLFQKRMICEEVLAVEDILDAIKNQMTILFLENPNDTRIAVLINIKFELIKHKEAYLTQEISNTDIFIKNTLGAINNILNDKNLAFLTDAAAPKFILSVRKMLTPLTKLMKSFGYTPLFFANSIEIAITQKAQDVCHKLTNCLEEYNNQTCAA